MRHIFALVSQTKLVSAADLYRLVPALEVNLVDCADVWGKEAPEVVVIDDFERLDPAYARHIHPVVFTESERVEDVQDGVLAEHWWDPLSPGPAARVFVDRSSGLMSGPNSTLESAGHELLEGLVDPQIGLFADHPTKPGVQMALEVCDMVQDTYAVSLAGHDFQVANFVTPQYFSRALASNPEQLKSFFDAGGRLDFARRLKHPGELGPDGYAVERRTDAQGNTNVFPVYPNGAARQLRPGKRHPWARSVRRGALQPA